MGKLVQEPKQFLGLSKLTVQNLNILQSSELARVTTFARVSVTCIWLRMLRLAYVTDLFGRNSLRPLSPSNIRDILLKLTLLPECLADLSRFCVLVPVEKDQTERFQHFVARVRWGMVPRKVFGLRTLRSSIARSFFIKRIFF